MASRADGSCGPAPVGACRGGFRHSQIRGSGLLPGDTGVPFHGRKPAVSPTGRGRGFTGWGHGWAVEIWTASSPVRPMLLVHPDRQASHALSQPPPQPLSAPQGLRIRIRLRLGFDFGFGLDWIRRRLGFRCRFDTILLCFVKLRGKIFQLLTRSLGGRGRVYFPAGAADLIFAPLGKAQ